MHVTMSPIDSTNGDDMVVYMDDLEKRKEVYGICGECNEPGTGEHWCQHCNVKIFKYLRKALKIGLVEIKLLMNSYDMHNLMLYAL